LLRCGMGTNGVGRRTRMDDGTGYTTWSYDSRGRVSEAYQSVTGGGTFRTQWGYNSADLPVWMRYPADNAGNLGETVYNTYYPQLAVDRVYGTSVYLENTDYDAAGRVDRRMLGASPFITQDYVYNAWNVQGGRLAQLKTGYSTVPDSLQDLRYTYDLTGNVLTISDYKAGGTQTQTFAYDALDRLRTAVASGGTGGTYSLQNYDYDTQGRLELNATVTNFYENPAHIHAVSRTSTGNIYSYDANGNQTSRRVGGITYTLIYDAESRLVQIKLGKIVQATYTYDGDGNRVKTVVGSTTTTYIGNYLERECINTTCTLKRYYYAAGQRVALRKGDGTLYYLLTDHLGSTAITATSGGSFSAELRYYPWGGTRYSSGTTPTSYRYTGQREAEVGLYYYNARFYDASLGRFVQADSIIANPGYTIAWDRFAYTANNPIRYTDPSGHLACNAPNVADGDCSEKSWATLPGLIASFGINLSEGFSLGNMWEILTVLRAIGAAFSEAMSDHPDSVTAFRTVFDGLTLSLDPSISPMDGRSNADSIRLRPGRITGRLLGHELGHVFAFRIKRGDGGMYSSGHPEMMLIAGLYHKSGAFMTGENRAYGDGSYRRNDLVLGYESGYECDTVPCQYHLMSEIYPSEYMDADSNSAGEEWADMFLNWSLGGFNDSTRGQYYEMWMTSNMSEWINTAGGR
jgi:RHS repeat-associated protein